MREERGVMNSQSTFKLQISQKKQKAKVIKSNKKYKLQSKAVQRHHSSSTNYPSIKTLKGSNSSTLASGWKWRTCTKARSKPLSKYRASAPLPSSTEVLVVASPLQVHQPFSSKNPSPAPQPLSHSIYHWWPSLQSSSLSKLLSTLPSCPSLCDSTSQHLK